MSHVGSGFLCDPVDCEERVVGGYSFAFGLISFVLAWCGACVLIEKQIEMLCCLVLDVSLDLIKLGRYVLLI